MKNKDSEAKNTSTENQKTDIKKEVISWVKLLAFVLVFAWFITSFIIINARVPSGSMNETIHAGDRLFGSRLTYLMHDPERGDIVVFHYPVDDALGIKNNYVKRIIGLPGETVEIKQSQVYINGELLEEDYLKEPGAAWVNANDGLTFNVPEDCYFVMGDNRNNSLDGRYWQYEAMRRFKEAGKEISVQDAYKLSFVRKDQILGKVYLRYWPLTQISILH